MTNRVIKLHCANGAMNILYPDYSSLTSDILRVEPEKLKVTVFNGFSGCFEIVELFLSNESTARYNPIYPVFGTISEEELNDSVFVLKKTPLKHIEAILYEGEAYLLTFDTGLIEPCTIKGITYNGNSRCFKVKRGKTIDTLPFHKYGLKYVFLGK